MKKEDITSYLDYVLLGTFLLFFISVVFSFRAISSMSVGLILIIGLVRNRKFFNHHFHSKPFSYFVLGCSLLFILQCFSLSYTYNLAEGIRLLQRSSGIVFIPFAAFSNHDFLTAKFQKLSFYFAAILCVGSLYCLTAAFAGYFSGVPVSIFFYHEFVKPLSQHAVQFSIMIFIALVFLVGNRNSDNYFHNLLNRLMIAFLSCVLVLLSSKLVISIYLLYLVYFFFHKEINRAKSKIFIPVFIVTVIITIVTPNPIGNRFRGMFMGNALLFEQDKFSPGIYFNGVQFRLLEWKFTYEILNEQQAWFKGLTPGDAQSFLDRKYIEADMYTGITGTQDRGFLGYHTHNQFLQALLENGLPGLVLFLFICFSLFKMAIEYKNGGLKWFTLLLLIYCFTDAPLETQYGIVIFTFFPAFLYMSRPLPIAASPFTNQLSQNLTETVPLEQPN